MSPTAPAERIVTEKPPQFPVRREAAIERVVKRIRQGQMVQLEGVPELERALEDYHGGGHAWYISSGTAALMAILLGHEVGPGDEVITTPYTWGATVSAILAVGAIPVFADVLRSNGVIDPETIEPLITPKTKAIMGVHIYGSPFDARACRAIAEKHGLYLFEDGSQAHGAKLDGQKVGRLGHAAAFSCMGMKLLAGTEGGYALFADEGAAEKAKLYGGHPRGLSAEQVERLTAGGLLDNLQIGWRPCVIGADLVLENLPYLDEEVAARRRNADLLREHVADIPGIEFPEEIEGGESAYHMLSLLHFPEVCGVNRDDFITKSRNFGSGGFDYLPEPLYRFARMNPHDYKGPLVFWHEGLRRAGVDYRKTRCPHAEWRGQHSWEFGFNWTQDNPKAMEQIAAALRKAADPDVPVPA